jgi:phage-related tail fiber protein
MLIDGINLPTTATIVNAAVENVTSFPSSPGVGRAVFLTIASGQNAPGFYVFDGSTWANGDVTGVTAGSGLTGGGTSGTVTLAVDTSIIAAKTYVDALKQGFDYKDSVKCATTQNITLSGNQTIDNYTTITGDRVLVKSNTAGSTNGIYVASSGAWSRATDADTSGKVTTGMYVFVEQGSVNGGSAWVLTAPDVTLGSTALTFAQFNSGSQVTTPYDVAGSIGGKPDSSATVFVFPSVRSFTIAASYAGSRAVARTAATANTTFNIYKNGSAYGSFTFSAGSSSATFSGSPGVVTASDTITVVAPAVPDASLADIGFTFVATV